MTLAVFVGVFNAFLRSFMVLTCLYSQSNVSHRPLSDLPCGMTKNVSQMGSSLMGKCRNSAPPLLLIHTMVMGTSLRQCRPLTSCKKLVSPISAMVCPAVFNAYPAAVEIKPSMPLAPRCVMN